MRLAIVSDRVYPYFKGGAEKRYWEIATRLVKKGHEVHFYTGQWPGMAKDEVVDGVHLHGVYKVGQFYVNGRKSITESLKYTFALFIPLLRAKYDVMDCESVPLLSLFPARLACWVKRKKLVASWHEAWGKEYWKEYLGWKWPMGASVEWLAVRLPDTIIAVSEHTKRGLVEKLRVPQSRIKVVPLGADLHTIKKARPAEEKSDIIYAGRLLSHKNVALLLKSIADLRKEQPRIRCLIVGDGPQRKGLETLAKRLRIDKNVRFLGFVETPDEVYSLMKSSKVFVLPSTREGFGLVVVEANACGIPVVTVDHPDNAAKELIIEGKNGIVCDFSEKAITRAISKSLARRRVKTTCPDAYDWNRVSKTIEAVISR